MQPLSVSQQESLREATAAYHRALVGTPAALAYLDARGIDAGLAATFRLGVVADPEPGHARYQGMLAIPYLDRDSEPLQLRFRCLEQHDCRKSGHGKYMTMADDPVRPFNVRAIHEAVAAHADEIHVTEGELDAIILNSLGMHAIAIPGASLWRPYFRRMLAGFSRVWVWGDPDEAGAEFTNKLTASMRQAKGVAIRGGDVNEIYLSQGPEALFALTAPTF